MVLPQVLDNHLSSAVTVFACICIMVHDNAQMCVLPLFQVLMILR